MLHDQVSVEGLKRAIMVWETSLDIYKQNMADIRSKHKLTWWARTTYWANERCFHKSFTALIRRRIQLQTAIRDQKESKNA